MALALQAVQNIAERAIEVWLKAVDMGLVLQCARKAPDSAVCNAALTLLAVLASKLPDVALQHVLEVSGPTMHAVCQYTLALKWLVHPQQAARYSSAACSGDQWPNHTCSLHHTTHTLVL